MDKETFEAFIKKAQKEVKYMQRAELERRAFDLNNAATVLEEEGLDTRQAKQMQIVYLEEMTRRIREEVRV